MNLSTKFAFVAIACFTICFASGCVGPMACGPGGCDAATGPLAFNSCDGCSDCEGCGELYIDPWINHPADCCDPCDQCGNFNGQSCGKCRSVFSGIKSLWGYRIDNGCDDCGNSGCGGGCCAPEPSCGALGGLSCGCEDVCSGGCDGGGCEVSCGMEATCGFEVGSQSACGSCSSCQGGGDGIHYVSSEPVLSEPIDPSMISRPYQPHRTKKIFRPKTNVAGGGSGHR